MPAEPHPDADTLTAYVERSLSAAESNRVLGHLAACSRCRDVVSLSLVEPAEALTGAQPVAITMFEPNDFEAGWSSIGCP